MFHFAGLTHGKAGVDLFFCISGFVMAGQMERTPAQFIRDRFIRIYPTFLAAMALAFAMLSLPFSVQKMALSLILYPDKDLIYLYPAWSLGYEAIFYAACVGAMFVGWWPLAVAYGVAFVLQIPILGSSFILEFAAGFMLARRNWWGLALIALAALTDWRASAYGIPAAAILFLSVKGERFFRHRLVEPIAMVGAASYSIYLVHAIIGTRFIWLPDFVIINLCLAGGIAFHFLIEKPLIAYCKRLSRPPRYGYSTP